MNGPSSLPYWDERWGASPSQFETSWPDNGCRALELAFVKKVLKGIPADRMVLEIGCGNFQLAEDPEIPALLKGRYIGIDGCMKAIQAAADRGLPGLQFVGADLTACSLESFADPAHTFLLSKRTIQNIAPEERRHLWPEIRQYLGGLLIEDFVPFRRFVDEHRYNLGRRPLEVPAFNWPIDLNEQVSSFKHIQFYAFMGYYMQITRCQGQIPDDIRAAALRLSQWAIETDRGQPSAGPVVGMTFGEWRS